MTDIDEKAAEVALQRFNDERLLLERMYADPSKSSDLRTGQALAAAAAWRDFLAAYLPGNDHGKDAVGLRRERDSLHTALNEAEHLLFSIEEGQFLVNLPAGPYEKRMHNAGVTILDQATKIIRDALKDDCNV